MQLRRLQWSVWLTKGVLVAILGLTGCAHFAEISPVPSPMTRQADKSAGVKEIWFDYSDMQGTASSDDQMAKQIKEELGKLGILASRSKAPKDGTYIRITKEFLGGHGQWTMIFGGLTLGIIPSRAYWEWQESFEVFQNKKSILSKQYRRKYVEWIGWFVIPAAFFSDGPEGLNRQEAQMMQEVVAETAASPERAAILQAEQGGNAPAPTGGGGRK